MDLLIEWLPKVVACLIFASICLGLWLGGKGAGKFVSQRWPLGIAHRSFTVAAYSVLAVCLVVFTRLSVVTLDLKTDIDLDVIAVIMSNTAAASGVASAGVLLLLAIAKLGGVVLPNIPPFVRFGGRALSALCLLALGLALAFVPALPASELDPAHTNQALARLFGAFGQVAFISVFVWQLIPWITNARGHELEIATLEDA